MRKSLALALSLLGLFDSLYLLYTYTSPSRPMVCIGTGCDAVRASAYSTLWGVSMPVFGVLGYTLLGIVIIAESLFSAPREMGALRLSGHDRLWVPLLALPRIPASLCDPRLLRVVRDLRRGDDRAVRARHREPGSCRAGA